MQTNQKHQICDDLCYDLMQLECLPQLVIAKKEKRRNLTERQAGPNDGEKLEASARKNKVGKCQRVLTRKTINIRCIKKLDNQIRQKNIACAIYKEEIFREGRKHPPISVIQSDEVIHPKKSPFSLLCISTHLLIRNSNTSIPNYCEHILIAYVARILHYFHVSQKNFSLARCYKQHLFFIARISLIKQILCINHYLFHHFQIWASAIYRLN